MSAVHRIASTSALAALVLTTMWLFWPSQLGGSTTYLTTYGSSMEPTFQAQDMAILRAAERYAVGDVVAYYSPTLNTVVMHRVVSADANGFVTQGDNNDWLDGDQPSQDEILGRLFLRIPRGGIALDALTSPGALVFLVGGLLAVTGYVRRPPVRRHLRAARRRIARRIPAPSVAAHAATVPPGVAPSLPVPPVSAAAPPPPSRPGLSMSARSLARQVALGSAAVALVALAVGGVLLVVPSTQTDTRSLQVTQQGEFSYTGVADRGTTYPSGVISTGDPVWAKLAREVTVSFTDTVTGPDLTALDGSLRLDVVVTATDGWTAVVTQGAPAAFDDGGTATASVVVEPAAAGALLSRHYAEIGGAGGGSTLSVTPVVELTGQAAGQPFVADSPAGLPFQLDASALRPGGDETALTPMAETAVEVDEVVERSFPVLGLHVPIDVARLVAFAVFAGALLVLAASAWASRTRRGDAAGRFLVRHADRILPVSAFDPGPMVFDVADAEALRRMAERFDTVVLHHATDDGDVFAVRDADATYRFVVPGLEGRRRGKPPVPGGTAHVPGGETHVPAPAHAAVPAPRASSEPVDATGPAGAIWAAPAVEDDRPDQTYPLPLIEPPANGRHWGRVA